MYLCFLISKPI